MSNKRICRTLLLLIATGECLAAEAALPVGSEVHVFNIPAENAGSAIRSLGMQAEVNILVSGLNLKGMRTRAIRGKLSVDAALRQLIKGTGLTYSYVTSGRTVALTLAHARGSPAHPPTSSHRSSLDPPKLPPPPAAAAAELQPVVLPQIEVTAQRRSEDLQDVPLSADVVGAQTLIAQNITSLYDLSELNPSVHVGENSRSANISIRGTSSGESQTFDQSVAMIEDDVYEGRARLAGAPLFDLANVQVLKGPQDTFFGKDAIAGAINIVTAKPEPVFDAALRTAYGQFGEYTGEGFITGPLTDSLSARVAVLAEGMQGWLHNETIDRDVPGENTIGGRLTLDFSPGDDLDVLLKIEGSKSRNVGALALQSADCPPPPPFKAAGFCEVALASAEPIGLGNDSIAQNAGQEIVLTVGEYVLTVKDTLPGGLMLTSVTGFTRYGFLEREDTDATAEQLLNVAAPEDYRQFSQELRCASPLGKTVEYMGGLYFDTYRLSYSHPTSYFFLTPELQAVPALAPLGPFLPLGQNILFSQPEKTYSGFASITWHLTRALRWSVGTRFSEVQKSYHWSLLYGTAAAPYGDIVPLPAREAALAQGIANAADLGVAGSLAGSRRDSGFMPSTQLRYNFTPTAMAYFSYARGWKSGGFNGNDTTDVAANIPFAPEHVDAYEVGLKSEWDDRRLRLNLDVFRSDYTDLQVATNVAGPSGAFLSLVQNAASSRTEGVELQTDWIPSSPWRFSVNATYDEARYLRYPNVAPTQLQQALGFQSQDLSGRPTEFAPRWSGSLEGSYILHLAGWQLTSTVSGIGSSSFFLTGNDDPLVEQGAYARLDARVSLAGPDGHWTLDLIGKNLTNRQILTFGINWPTSPGSVWLQTQEPRNLAVQLRYRW